MTMACVVTSFLASVVAAEGSQQNARQGADYDKLSVSRLQCVIGNNAALGEHRAWYNGLFSARASDADASPFVPQYAGLNLEHFFDTRPRPEQSEVFFEPRAAAMAFKRINDTTAELYQAATPVYGVESWTRFELKDPYYIDMTFRCIPHKADLGGGILGVFWASYINAPEDKSIYFLAAGSTLDKPVWTQYCTQEHGRDSTVCNESDQLAIPFSGGAGTLFSSISPLRYSAPSFYGRFRDKVLIYIFEPGPIVRFSHSPSGGGLSASGDAHNPAWDFQLIVPGYKPGAEYGLKMRLVYKPWVDRQDVINEVRKYGVDATSSSRS